MCVLLTSAALATLYSHAVNFRELGAIYNNALKDRIGWLKVNCSVCFVWFCDFYGLYYTEPVDFMFIFFAATAECAFLVQSFPHKPMPILRAYRVSSVGVTILIVMVHVIPSTNAEVRSTALGNLFAIGAGIAAYIYTKWSYDFSLKCSLTSSQLLAVRSYVLVFIAAVSALYLPSPKNIEWTFYNGVMIVLTALLTFILPLYAGQRALMRIGPDLNAMFVAITPLVLCILDLLINERFVATRFVFGILLTGFMILPKLLELNTGRTMQAK